MLRAPATKSPYSPSNILQSIPGERPPQAETRTKANAAAAGSLVCAFLEGRDRSACLVAAGLGANAIGENARTQAEFNGNCTQTRRGPVIAGRPNTPFENCTRQTTWFMDPNGESIGFTPEDLADPAKMDKRLELLSDSSIQTYSFDPTPVELGDLSALTIDR